MSAAQIVFAVFGITIPLVYWIGCVYIPSVTDWNAVDRFVWISAAVIGIWLAYGVVALMAWTGYEPALVPYTAGLKDKRQNMHLIGVTVVFLFFGVWAAGFQLPLVAETTPGFFDPIPGVCGASSCSRNGNADVRYNPNGVFGQGHGLDSYSNFTHVSCMYDECLWAPLTGAPIIQFPMINPPVNKLPDYSKPPCPVDDPTGCVATDQGWTYPDWGKGLIHGLFLGFGISVQSPADVAPCPGVAQSGTSWIGLRPCPVCLQYILTYVSPTQAARIRNLYAHCGPMQLPGSHANLGWLCPLCPRIDEVKTPKFMRQQARALFIVSVLGFMSFFSVELLLHPRKIHAAITFFIFLVLLGCAVAAHN